MLGSYFTDTSKLKYLTCIVLMFIQLEKKLEEAKKKADKEKEDKGEPDDAEMDDEAKEKAVRKAEKAARKAEKVYYFCICS